MVSVNDNRDNNNDIPMSDESEGNNNNIFTSGESGFSIQSDYSSPVGLSDGAEQIRPSVVDTVEIERIKAAEARAKNPPVGLVLNQRWRSIDNWARELTNATDAVYKYIRSDTNDRQHDNQYRDMVLEETTAEYPKQSSVRDAVIKLSNPVFRAKLMEIWESVEPYKKEMDTANEQRRKQRAIEAERRKSELEEDSIRIQEEAEFSQFYALMQALPEHMKTRVKNAVATGGKSEL